MPAGGGSAPIAVDTRSCAQQWSFFNVQIMGDRDSEYWFHFHGARLGIPDGKTAVVVWSLGGPQSTGGMAMYGWMTNTRSRFASFCSTTGASSRKPTTTRLRSVVRVKDGWGAGPRFACLQPGRFVVELRDLANGKRMTVRMQRTGELIALAETSRGSGWLRASKRCEQR